MAGQPVHKKQKNNKDDFTLSGWSSEEEEVPNARVDVLLSKKTSLHHNKGTFLAHSTSLSGRI